MPFDPARAARFIDEAHRARSLYQNLPADIAPSSVAEAYAAQAALERMWVRTRGPVAGYKIATTTKVMQQLMGIDHPCCGTIFASTVHASPARIRLAGYMHVVIECELAVRLARDLGPGVRHTPESVRGAIGTVLPAFELIEDRRAEYKSCKALSLIADNCWNAGIVTGAEAATPGGTFDGIEGKLSINGREQQSGRTDGPLGALAWVANLAVERGMPLRAGQVIMTGSVIPTLPIKAGDRFVFALEGLGATEVVAE
jgi:2-keto-4-pentenoate hydratase